MLFLILVVYQSHKHHIQLEPLEPHIQLVISQYLQASSCLKNISSGGNTCRSILFGGRIEYSFCDVTKIYVGNSWATTLVSTQSRAGSLFGRVYHSIVNSVLVQIENIQLSAISTTFECEVASVTTSLLNTSIAFRDSSIKNINIYSYSKNMNAQASGIHSTIESSNVYIYNVVLESIKLKVDNDNYTASQFAGAIASTMSRSSSYSYGALQMDHVTINSIQIEAIFSSDKQVKFLIGKIIASSPSVFVQIIDSVSIGVSTVLGSPVSNCQLTQPNNNGC
ncbi:Hypothetical_protein [Hexamita inflata]|uniref:Hypothetical_protein n=1 Tax=Hexamita inflata TaxID=28002 RepID=A0AA86PFX3_9EUKA|nr:Hypothetical protein HINF_LOCUS25046 [Hexamita inflata]